MFSQPPFLASYTAPGLPLVWEPPRPKEDEFFPFVIPLSGARIRYWPDFCPEGEAERMLAYAQKLAPGAQLVDTLNAALLPPGVGRYPVPLNPTGENFGDVSVWGIVGQIGPSRFYVTAGWMADVQTGLRSGLQSSYMQKAGVNWDNQGQIVAGKNAWPWDTIYGYVSLEFPGEASLYWGNASTGPILG